MLIGILLTFAASRAIVGVGRTPTPSRAMHNHASHDLPTRSRVYPELRVGRNDRRGKSVGGLELRADRRLNPNRRAGKEGRRHADDDVEAGRYEVGGCASVNVEKGGGARAGTSARPRAPGREPRPPARKTASAPGYISRTELCRRLGISRATSYRLERDGFLPRPVRIGPRTTRWPVAELAVFERRLAEDRGAANVHASEAKSAD
jgi:predicted DNA-binding transcriptional regulator AlpA